ncbi:MAG TPA: hypothetical protein VN285_01720 [Candidatus Deferrimicrobium sp.]|nr:hypothetical protein [Candidatus Deferrimicrobium sp.]
MLSRQAMRPTGKSAWVSQTQAAIEWLNREGYTINTSLGMQTWELLTALSSIVGAKQTLLIPAESQPEFEQTVFFATDQFDLRADLVRFVPVFGNQSDGGNEELLRKRDKMAIERADLVVPVSVRPGGRMASWLERLRRFDRPINEQYRVEYERRREPLAYRIDSESLNTDLKLLEGRFLIHWTRGTQSAWPTEKLIDYYSAVVRSDDYPRDGFRTLLNILTTGLIVATPKHKPAGIPTVSFSSLSPAEVVPLMRWRARDRQMSFEPYGIGIDFGLAASLGIKPVLYYDRSSGPVPRHTEPWLCQSRGRKTDWRAENEYRHLGNVDLLRIPVNKMTAVCLTQSEAATIRRVAGIHAESLMP